MQVARRMTDSNADPIAAAKKTPRAPRSNTAPPRNKRNASARSSTSKQILHPLGGGRGAQAGEQRPRTAGLKWARGRLECVLWPFPHHHLRHLQSSFLPQLEAKSTAATPSESASIVLAVHPVVLLSSSSRSESAAAASEIRESAATGESFLAPFLLLSHQSIFSRRCCILLIHTTTSLLALAQGQIHGGRDGGPLKRPHKGWYAA
jgi:hypothetical protein